MAFWGEWRPYVPVAQRRAKAQREMGKLHKKGQNIQPVTIEGRTIARSFWGKGWCDHLESFSDYANRLPRGRTYVRNGSVCHLDIQPGHVEAYVSGSELYRVHIRISALDETIWRTIKRQCAGHIGSMLELLQGKLSDQVMAIVTHRQQGLFPRPGEIQLDCSCPDWAAMCKHVAAVLYGVGSRLDRQPELLFVLRGVEAQELIVAELALPEATVASDSLADEQLGAIFGIDLDLETDARPAPAAQASGRTPQQVAAPRTRQSRVRQSTSVAPSSKTTTPSPAHRSRPAAHTPTHRAPSSQVSPAPVPARAAPTSLPRLRPTGKSVARLRHQQSLSVAQFAARLGVSASTVYRWEATQGPLTLQTRVLQALAALQQSVQPKKTPTADPGRVPKR